MRLSHSTLALLYRPHRQHATPLQHRARFVYHTSRALIYAAYRGARTAVLCTIGTHTRLLTTRGAGSHCTYCRDCGSIVAYREPVSPILRYMP